MKLNLATTSLFLAPALGAALSARADSSACSALQFNGGNGGRKIGIVIDSSGSMYDTDPEYLRVVAAKNLNSALVTQSEASGDKKADLVTVIDFDSYAEVMYDLGDPSGAEPAIDGINASGGTAIYDGVAKATDELSKAGYDPTANRTGMVVLTDGQDGSTTALIKELNRAASLGIRVSFGFLDPSSSAAVDPDTLAAILLTGGTYSTINSASAQQSFVNLVLSHGLTGSDNGASVSSILVPGLSIAQFESSTGTNAFTYTAQSGEKLNFTIQALSGQSLDTVINDKGAGKELTKASTDASGIAFLEVDATQDGELELLITSKNLNSSALFTVGMNSSLGIVNCTLPGTTPTNTTNNNGGKNTTTNATATHTPPAQYTGGASSGMVTAGTISVALGTLFAFLL